MNNIFYYYYQYYFRTPIKKKNQVQMNFNLIKEFNDGNHCKSGYFKYLQIILNFFFSNNNIFFFR